MRKARPNAVKLCPVCGGEPTVLGTLGMLRWYRCRACGMEYHGKVRSRPRRRKNPLSARESRSILAASRYPAELARAKSTHPMMKQYLLGKVAGKANVVGGYGRGRGVRERAWQVERAAGRIAMSGSKLRAMANAGKRDRAVIRLGGFIAVVGPALSSGYAYEIYRKSGTGPVGFGWAGSKPLALREARSKLRMFAGRGFRRNSRSLDTAWTGKKADYVSPEGNYGEVGYSELAMHTGAAGRKVVRFALFSDRDRWPYVTWAHVKTADGQVLDGTPGEVLPSAIRRKLGGFGQEKLPMAARMKR